MRRLLAAGAVSVVGYALAAFALGASGSRGDVHAFLALFGALFAVYFYAIATARRVRGLGLVILFAALFRLALLPAGLRPDDRLDGLAADLRSEAVGYSTFLLYDNDVWRYLWDGHVGAAGLDPYAFTPAAWEERADDGDPQAEALFAGEVWQDVYDNVYFKDYTTVYPPLAQLLFRLSHALAPGSVFAWKLLLVFLDLATCVLLAVTLERRGRGADAIVYAWNPLVLKEVAGSGHVDALAVFCLVLAVWAILGGRRRTALAACGAAGLAKLVPAVAAVFFLKRTSWRQWWVLPLVVTAGYLPYLSALGAMARGFQAFQREWTFNAGPWALARQLAGRPGADLVAVLGVAALLAWALYRDDGTEERLAAGCLAVLGGVVVLGPTVMPWYLIWALPFAAWRRGWAWPALTGLSLVSYLIYVDQVERVGWRVLEFGVFFALLAWETARSRISPPPAPCPSGSGCAAPRRSPAAPSP